MENEKELKDHINSLSSTDLDKELLDIINKHLLEHPKQLGELKDNIFTKVMNDDNYKRYALKSLNEIQWYPKIKDDASIKLNNYGISVSLFSILNERLEYRPKREQQKVILSGIGVNMIIISVILVVISALIFGFIYFPGMFLALIIATIIEWKKEKEDFHFFRPLWLMWKSWYYVLTIYKHPSWHYPVCKDDY